MYIHHKLTDTDASSIHVGYTIPDMASSHEPPRNIERDQPTPDTRIIDIAWRGTRPQHPITIETTEDGVSEGLCNLHDNIYMIDHPEWYHTGYSRVELIDKHTQDVLYQMDFPVTQHISLAMINTGEAYFYTPPRCFEHGCFTSHWRLPTSQWHPQRHHHSLCIYYER